jgi:hypothetical protein
MKRTLALAAILAGLLTVTLPAPAAKADVRVSFSFFHDNLAPYGSWVTVGSYGRCWYPAGVSAGWQPYTVGHWGWGDYGWTWVSADPWGDWTYRYGTWTFQPPYGWVWVPGYVWSPAWVTWSYTNDYIGWAPIPPTFSFAVTGYFGSPVVVNRSWYCFVPRRGFATTNVVNVRVPVHENQVLLARSQKVTRFPVSGGVVRNEGLDVRSVERTSSARVQRVSARQMRAAPARIETARMTGRRVAVADPASTKSAPSARSERSRVERSGATNEVRREKATRPSAATRPKREPAPDARREREISRPSEPATRKAQPSDSGVRRPSRPSKPKPEARTSAPAPNREKPRAVGASAPRPQASALDRSRPSSSEARKASAAKPTKNAKPTMKKPGSTTSSEKERGRP